MRVGLAARHLGVSRARVTQVLRRLKMDVAPTSISIEVVDGKRCHAEVGYLNDAERVYADCACPNECCERLEVKTGRRSGD